MPADSENRALATLFASNTSMDVQLTHGFLLCYVVHNSLDPSTVSHGRSWSGIRISRTLEQVLHIPHGPNRRRSQSNQGLHHQE